MTKEEGFRIFARKISLREAIFPWISAGRLRRDPHPFQHMTSGRASNTMGISSGIMQIGMEARKELNGGATIAIVG
jgi:hypothetical protein